ncbi:hypothetical protein GCM10011335_50570 [Aureimonas glaciei]|uniref:Uncharacterized protein n=1 Tax=Aureimonas glaciei TaxID=1776957 RepID=A0A916YE14_9HYPH|nr:hypothetical protein GCM10011335_50570 [Aureimonas glaciei]
MKAIAAIGSVILLTCVVPSAAFCTDTSFYGNAPAAPGALGKPSVPYCLAGYSYSRTHTCETWELESYKSDVETYIRKLRTYAEEAQTFANEAVNFANQAADFASCQAKEVATQHE